MVLSTVCQPTFRFLFLSVIFEELRCESVSKKQASTIFSREWNFILRMTHCFLNSYHTNILKVFFFFFEVGRILNPHLMFVRDFEKKQFLRWTQRSMFRNVFNTFWVSLMIICIHKLIGIDISVVLHYHMTWKF